MYHLFFLLFVNPFEGVRDWITDKIGDAFEWAISKTFGRISDAVRDELLIPVLESTLRFLVETPFPDNVDRWGAPTNEPWRTLYTDFYQPVVLVGAISVFIIAVAATMLTNIFEDSAKARIAVKRLAFVLPFMYCWWWFGAWFLRFNEIVTIALLDGTPAQFVQQMDSWLTLGGVGAVAALSLYIIGFVIIGAVLAVYWIRYIAIILYMASMPLLFAMWCIPIQPISGWSKSMMKKFPPLVIVTIPVAFYFQFGTVLVESTGGVLQAFVALVTLGVTILFPVFTFNFANTVMSAVSTTANAGKAAAAGAKTGKTPKKDGSGGVGSEKSPGDATTSGATTGFTSSSTSQTSSAKNVSSGGSASNSGTDKFSRSTDLSFKPPQKRTMRARRAAKVGAVARNSTEKVAKGAAKTTASGMKKAAESTAKNYYKDENMAKGLAKDAGRGAVNAAQNATQKVTKPGKQTMRGSTNYLHKTAQRAKNRQEEIRQEYSDSTEENDS